MIQATLRGCGALRALRATAAARLVAAAEARGSQRRTRAMATAAASGGEAAAAAWCWPASARAAADVVVLSSEDKQSATAIPVIPVRAGASAAAAVAALPEAGRRWVAATLGGGGFDAKSGGLLVVPGADGSVDRVLLVVDSATDVWGFAALARLPAGGSGGSGGGGAECGGEGGGALYALDAAALAALDADGDDGRSGNGGVLAGAADAALLGWMLGTYRFDRYKGQSNKAGAAAKPPPPRPRLVCPAAARRRRVEALARAFFLCRDAINTPANDMGPSELAAEAAALAAAHPGARCDVVEGEALLDAGYPAVYTVGQASARPPALIDINWAPPGVADADKLPLLALVGKGVVFDTGGLNLKTAAGMRTMKKDMGGGALVLALAHFVMAAGLSVRLRALVPAVENAVAGSAYRPLDVLRTRAGITIEQGNCDAEGRLILADALFEAASARPDLVIDAATLTGAARTALGPEVPAVFTPSDAVWRDLKAAAVQRRDPLWRLPLHEPYRRLLDSKIADIGSVAGGDAGVQGGAIVAALFLREFAAAGWRAGGVGVVEGGVESGGGGGDGDGGGSNDDDKALPWVHIDTGAWVAGGAVKPGRPEGGEALGLLALAQMLSERYGSSA